jgi:hypothetical protein
MAIPSDPPEPKFKWPRQWWVWLMDLWVWLKSKQPIPDANDFDVTESPNGVVFSIKDVAIQVLANASTWPLKITNATDAGDAIVNIAYGTVAGRLAIAAMPVDGYDLTLTATGVRYIYGQVTWGYSAPTWTSSACTLIEDSSAAPKASTATLQYVYIGRAERESDGGGGFRVKEGSIFNNLSGSQGAVRGGVASPSFVDDNWLL